MLRVIIADAAEDRTKLKHQLQQLKVNMLDTTTHGKSTPIAGTAIHQNSI